MILRVSLVENKLALLRTYSEDLLVKSKEAGTVKTLVLAVFLKMMDKTRENVSDSFSEGTFQLSLTRLGSIYMIELVACRI